MRTTCGDILARSDCGIKLSKRLTRIFVPDTCFYRVLNDYFMIRVRHVFVAPCIFHTTIDTYTMVKDMHLIMSIQFRGSDFGLVAKQRSLYVRAKSKQVSCAEMVLGSFFFLLV